MRYQIGICDDEKGTCSDLEKYIESFFVNQQDDVDIYVWYDAESCIDDIKSKVELNIIFIDIELPGVNGINLGKMLREELKNYGIQIIYISSKTNYALELFQVHPYDFLIKPIEQYHVMRLLSDLLIVNANDSRLYHYTFNKIQYTIPLGDILYIESRGRSLFIRCVDGSVKRFNGRIKNEINKLSEEFVIVNQSYIVNLRYVVECSYNKVMLLGDVEISVSNKYRDSFRNVIQLYNMRGK